MKETELQRLKRENAELKEELELAKLRAENARLRDEIWRLNHTESKTISWYSWTYGWEEIKPDLHAHTFDRGNITLCNS